MKAKELKAALTSDNRDVLCSLDGVPYRITIDKVTEHHSTFISQNEGTVLEPKKVYVLKLSCEKWKVLNALNAKKA